MAAAVVAVLQAVKENSPTPSPPPATQGTTAPSVTPPSTESAVSKPDQPKPVPKPAATPADSQPGQIQKDCDGCPEMVMVPAGEFRMGSPPGEEESYGNEEPQHRVTIRQPFAVGRYEVTRSEYARFAEATGRGEGKGCFSWTGTEWKKDASKAGEIPGSRKRTTTRWSA